MGIKTFLFLLFVSKQVLAQKNKEDSVRLQKELLVKERVELEKERKRIATSYSCVDYWLTKTPDWADSLLVCKSYIRNCMWSSAYMVLNRDSTFLYVYNGEGGAYYAHKGKWNILNDSLLVIKSVDSLSQKFQKHMTSVDKKKYKLSALNSDEFLIKDNELLFIPNESRKKHR